MYYSADNMALFEFIRRGRGVKNAGVFFGLLAASTGPGCVSAFRRKVVINFNKAEFQYMTFKVQEWRMFLLTNISLKTS